MSTEKSKLDIKFWDLWNEESFVDLIGTDLPLDSIAKVLKGYYAYKLGVQINNQNYEWIKELEGILELHNLVREKIDNI